MWYMPMLSWWRRKHAKFRGTINCSSASLFNKSKKYNTKSYLINRKLGKDLVNYSKEDLKILLKELKQGVQKRIEVTSQLGRDRPHGQRQGAEQDLIKSIEKHLGK